MNTYLLSNNNFEFKIYNIIDKERKMTMAEYTVNFGI